MTWGKGAAQIVARVHSISLGSRRWDHDTPERLPSSSLTLNLRLNPTYSRGNVVLRSRGSPVFCETLNYSPRSLSLAQF